MDRELREEVRQLDRRAQRRQSGRSANADARADRRDGVFPLPDVEEAVDGAVGRLGAHAPAAGAAANGSGAKGAAAVVLAAGSTATALNLAPASLVGFSAGQMVVVDADYAGQTGYVGSGVSAAYVRSAASVNSDPDYIRRLSFNVALVASVTGAGLALAQPLLAGAPASGMKVQAVEGFVDREGGSFFQEWSALFVMAGEQGERILYHYPRLQPTGGAQEQTEPLAAPLEWVALNASFRAMPVVDANDGEQVLCFRSFLPSPMTLP